MSFEIKKKHATVLILYTIVMFALPVLAIIYEPVIAPETFQKLGNCWRYGGSITFVVLVIWVITFGIKRRSYY